MFEAKFKRVTGIGSALVDILIHETDDFLKKFDKEKGGMTYHEASEIQEIISQSRQSPAMVSGGAACNTIVGVSKLGGKSRFIGRRGNDAPGEFFEKQVEASGVETFLQQSESATGQVLSVITPDAQRSMFTCLGASVEMKPEDISPECFKDTDITMIEGYLLFNPELMFACLKAAKQAGSLIALDLASFEVVNAAKDILDDIVKDYVDILIANEDEALAFTGEKDEAKALEKLSRNTSLAALKVGSRGSFISHADITTKIEPVAGKDPIDTTGAGDLWAAGFLFGLVNGYSLEDCGKIASACGYEVCQVVGAQIPEEGWSNIRKLL